MPCKIFSSIPVLYPLNAISTPDIASITWEAGKIILNWNPLLQSFDPSEDGGVDTTPVRGRSVSTGLYNAVYKNS